MRCRQIHQKSDELIDSQLSSCGTRNARLKEGIGTTIEDHRNKEAALQTNIEAFRQAEMSGLDLVQHNIQLIHAENEKDLGVTFDKDLKASVTKRRGIGPIKTEISRYIIRKKLFIFQIVRLNGICIWQNYFCILPNFGDFGAKTSFFRYLINQKRNNFIKHCPPPVYQQAANIRDAYIYKT